jgi:dolichol-phosphate mannosyltransferase
MADGAAAGRVSICAVAPCFNEAGVVTAFYREVAAALDGHQWTLIFVDDGSTDATLSLLNGIAERDSRVQVFSLSRNFGHQVALSAGLDVADADAVVILDSDLQHPPSLIPEMVRLWQAGGFDVVSAVRRHTAGASAFKQWSARMFYWLINKLSDTPIIPGAADFCLLSRRAHHALLQMPERHRFLRGMVSWIGFARTTITFDAPERQVGSPKYTPLRSLALAWDAILSFSATPMRLATRVGAVVSGCGAAYLAYVVARYFLLADLERGWGSLMATLLVLGGLQLTFIGLMGEYLVRVFEESKRRPLYLFKQDPRGSELTGQRER